MNRLVLSSLGLLLVLNIFSQKDPYFIRNLSTGTEANSVSFSADGTKLLAGFADGSVKLLDVQSGKTLAGAKEHWKGVMSVRIDPKERYFASGGDNTIRVYGMDGKLIYTFKQFTNTIYSIDIDPTGLLLAGGAMSRDFKIFDPLKGEPIKNIPGHTDVAMVVKFSRDGSLIASGSGDHTIKIWRTSGWELVRTIPSHGMDIYDLDFSYNGKMLASCSKDKTIMVYDLESGEVINTLTGHKNFVMGLAFAPGDLHLLSCSFDQEIRVWEIKTGKSVYSYIDHAAQVTDVCFAPDGLSFASSSHDKTVKLWKYDRDIFVDYYYSPVIIEKLTDMEDSGPRRKGEDKSGYDARMARFNEFRDKLYDEYYQKYLSDLQNGTLPSL